MVLSIHQITGSGLPVCRSQTNTDRYGSMLKEIKDKARNYCAYQERCHIDLQKKAREWGLNQQDTQALISAMIEEGFLNEMRFTEAFCRGKYIYKKWGKLKIIRELQMREISNYCIQKAIQMLDDLDYTHGLEDLILRHFNKSKETNVFKKRQKTAAFVIRKGYEPDLVWDILRKI